MDSPTAEGKVLLDPNTLSEDGTVSLNTYSLSKDGKLLAYAASQSGSDWTTVYVRDVKTGEDLQDKLEWVRSSLITWLPDASGLFYQRFPEPNKDETYIAKVSAPTYCFHLLGTPQTQDKVIFEKPEEPNWMFYSELSDDGKYQILYIRRGTERRNLIYYRDLNDDTFTSLIDTWEATFYLLGNDEQTFYFQTDTQADRAKIIAINLNSPERESWQDIVSEQEDTLEGCKLVKDEFFCLYMHHANHVLRRFSTEGNAKGEVELPGLGSIVSLNAERNDNELFYNFTSFLSSTLSFKFDLNTGESSQLAESAIDFDAEPYTTRQVFVTSKDGTKVPMFLVHRKDLIADGQNPTLLYGYGGFKIALTPSFSVSRLVWLESGGVLGSRQLTRRR